MQSKISTSSARIEEISFKIVNDTLDNQDREHIINWLSSGADPLPFFQQTYEYLIRDCEFHLLQLFIEKYNCKDFHKKSILWKDFTELQCFLYQVIESGLPLHRATNEIKYIYSKTTDQLHKEERAYKIHNLIKKHYKIPFELAESYFKNKCRDIYNYITKTLSEAKIKAESNNKSILVLLVKIMNLNFLAWLKLLLLL